jgi:Zn-dependent protease with chaperone function
MITRQQLRQCEHPKSKIIFYLTAVPVMLVIFLFLGWWVVSPDSLRNIISTQVITEDSVVDLVSDSNESGEEVEVISSSQKNANMKLVDLLRNDILVPLVASPITPIVIVGIFILIAIGIVGKLYGDSLGNGVKLSEKQFPQVYAMFDAMAKEVGLTKTPDIILMNGNGTLNAFACTIPMVRDAVVVYSDIFEKCIATNDMETLKFILGHELGHIRFNHTKWWYQFLTLPLKVVPGINYIFARALSRANEYSCDKLGAKLSGDSSGKSLMILSAGKHNYQDVNLEDFMQTQNKKSIWIAIANFVMDHPINSWRIIAIAKGHHGGLWFKKK